MEQDIEAVRALATAAGMTLEEYRASMRAVLPRQFDPSGHPPWYQVPRVGARIEVRQRGHWDPGVFVYANGQRFLWWPDRRKPQLFWTTSPVTWRPLAPVPEEGE